MIHIERVRKGKAETLCGTPVPTDARELDSIPIRLARKAVRSTTPGTDGPAWCVVADRCVNCFGRLLELDFATSSRVED